MLSQGVHHQQRFNIIFSLHNSLEIVLNFDWRVRVLDTFGTVHWLECQKRCCASKSSVIDNHEAGEYDPGSYDALMHNYSEAGANGLQIHTSVKCDYNKAGVNEAWLSFIQTTSVLAGKCFIKHLLYAFAWKVCKCRETECVSNRKFNRGLIHFHKLVCSMSTWLT